MVITIYLAFSGKSREVKFLTYKITQTNPNDITVTIAARDS